MIFSKNNSATPVALKNDTTYSGVNTAALNIISTNANTIGNYYVVISFPFADNLISSNALLSINENPANQINGVFYTTTADKQEASPTLSSNIASAVNGINGAEEYVDTNGKINNEGINQIKKAIQKTLATNPDTAGYQHLPVKVTISNVNANNLININYEIGNIKGTVNKINLGLNKNQISQKLTQWLNAGNNLVNSFQNYFNNNQNNILKFTLGRHVMGDYQWQNNQLPNVEIVSNSWKLLDNLPVIYTSENKFTPVNQKNN